MDDCIFCRIAQGKTQTEFVDESNHFVAFLDIRPHAPGHTLIVPKKHYATLLDIPSNLGEELLSFTKHIAGSLLETKQGDGFNVVMNNLPPAGQIVMHAHIHLIPRKEQDGLKSIG